MAPSYTYVLLNGRGKDRTIHAPSFKCCHFIHIWLAKVIETCQQFLTRNNFCPLWDILAMSEEIRDGYKWREKSRHRHLKGKGQNGC